MFCEVQGRIGGEDFFFLMCSFYEGKKREERSTWGKFIVLFHALLMREAGGRVPLFMNQTMMKPMYYWLFTNRNNNAIVSPSTFRLSNETELVFNKCLLNDE